MMSLAASFSISRPFFVGKIVKINFGGTVLLPPTKPIFYLENLLRWRIIC
jgi:hypothetical protein